MAANRLLTAGGRAGGEAMDWQRNKSGLIMNVYLGKLHKKIYKLIRYGLARSCPRKPRLGTEHMRSRGSYRGLVSLGC